jgi:hypothetical protein
MTVFRYGSGRAGAGITAVAARALSKRPPTTLDDVDQGHAVGHLWSNFGGGKPARTYQAVVTTRGFARWRVLETAKQLPGDIVSATGLRGVYGLMKLVDGYSGNCLRMVRTTDSATLDVGFVKIELPNGVVVEVVDERAINNFLNGTVGQVDIWYDQSGLGNDATQTTALSRPQWYGNRVGFLPSLSFSTNQNNGVGHKFLTQVTGSTIDLARRAMSVVFAGRNRGSLVQSCLFQAAPGAANTSQARFNLGLGLTTAQPSMGIQTEWAGFLAPSDELICGMVTSTAPNVTFWANSRRTTVSMAASAISLTGWNLGTNGAAASTTSHFDALGFLIWNRTLSEDEQRLVTAALSEVTGIMLQKPRNRIVIVGDSIAIGTGTFGNQNRPFFEKALYDTDVEYVNLGVAGRQIASDYADRTTIWSTAYDQTFPRTVVVLQSNGADILANRTGQQVYDDTLALANYLRTLPEASQRIRIVASTTTISTQPSGGQITEGADFRNRLLAGAFNFDAVVDILGDPIFGQPGAESDTTLAADGTHPTPLAYMYYAQLYANAIRPHLA